MTFGTEGPFWPADEPSAYVDVHTHLTHSKFEHDLSEVVQRAGRAGLGAIVVNGLEPKSNRQVLAMADTFATVYPACGIYPTDAVNDQLGESFPLKVEKFDVETEIAFIAELAARGQIAAVGECGLDGHWLPPSTDARQEYVFERLLEIAKASDVPVIIHSRKKESRVLDIVRSHANGKVDFHCYSGKAKPAVELAEKFGWCFSIPANVKRHEGFQKLTRLLPQESILTETDAPYLSAEPSTRNEPLSVVGTVNSIAELRGWAADAAKDIIWKNFQRIFRKKRISPH